MENEMEDLLHSQCVPAEGVSKYSSCILSLS